jgi:hypothetical protein
MLASKCIIHEGVSSTATVNKGMSVNFYIVIVEHIQYD